MNNQKFASQLLWIKIFIEYFKIQANEPGALPYQTQINQSLRALLPGSREHSAFYQQIKDELLHDKKFLH